MSEQLLIAVLVVTFFLLVLFVVIRRLRKPRIVVTEEFTAALDLLAGDSKCIFITGRAGCGKSTLLKLFREGTKKRLAVLAPTGVAALNVQGETIHSFFGFPPINPEEFELRENLSKKSLFDELECLIIDEVSMLRADLLDAMDASLRLNRNSTEPFGGVQVVFFGDLCQLPPVVTNEDRAILRKKYASEFFFDASVLKSARPISVVLTQVFRQRDEYFKEILNRLRFNELNSADYDVLNARVSDRRRIDRVESLILTTTNAIARSTNVSRLSELEGQSRTFHAVIKGKFPESTFPTDKDLEIKVGAQIIMLKNNKSKWVNGSIGHIDKIAGDSFRVKLDTGRHWVTRYTWEQQEHYYDSVKGAIARRASSSFKQFPVKLAWAITIHKSQGQTFESVAVDLGNGAFAHGQVYVALSRCKSLDGLLLVRAIDQSDVIFDSRVLRFVNKVERHSRGGSPSMGFE